MRPSTLRWRLPLSYAGIALIATLALGAILLAMLGAYYRGRERDYLDANARAVSLELAPLLAAGAAPAAFQARAEAYAFLLQARVEVADAAGARLADSGPPTMLAVEIAPAPGAPAAGAILVARSASSSAAPIPAPPPPPAPQAAGDPARAAEQARRLEEELARRDAERPLARTLYGFNLGPEAPREASRSALVSSAPILEPGGGQVIGAVRFSEGPAYGREIVFRVAWSLALAGLLAVALAAAAGWQISRQVTSPLSALTDATRQMAAGDLAARVDLPRRDEIGQLAGSFNAMAARVDGTVQTLRRFVADAAHELNTPLTALQANLDLACEAEGRAEMLAFVERASAETARLEQLARDLLNLSRAEAGHGLALAAPLDLAGLVRGLGERFAARAEQAGVELSVEAPSGPVIIHAPAAQVQQAVDNIVANAVKFTPAGGRVAVRVSEEPEGATVSVTDSGIGIPAEDLPFLFERFHRGRNAGAHPGSGLGLAIVRAIMAGHGGSAAAESDAAGSRFTLRWPRPADK